jgi:hypothetical protein
VEVSFELAGKDTERACDECDCAVGMAAGAAVRHLREPPPQHVVIRPSPAQSNKSLETVGDCG